MKAIINSSSKKLLIISIFLLRSVFSFSQNPACDAGVPYFYINMTGVSDSVWISPNVSRNEQCCGAKNSDDCIAFDVVLDTGAVGIQIDMIGADPAGSLFYSIDCLGSYPGGTVKCITGVGPHRITFCKPGFNKNVYKITSVSKPIFPADQHVRIGCSKILETLGIIDSTTTWNSLYPGAPGAYNSYLSCINCASPNYTPAANAPKYIDYYVCGFPIASNCGYNFTVCDTVRIYNDTTLYGIVPKEATFCNIGVGSGVNITAEGKGGKAPYNYTWRDSVGNIVGNTDTYFASKAGNYTVEIGDALNSSTCPSFYKTVAVTQGLPPTVNAGSDQKVCAISPTVKLEGIVNHATGGVWSGGTGTFNPGNTFLNTLYTPSSTEIAAGSVTLTLTSDGAGGGCTNSSDQIKISFSDTIKVNIPTVSLGCNNSSTTLTANVTGGSTPLSYQWNNGSTSSSIVVGEGNYSVTVTDIVGCTGTKTYNLVAPPALAISFTSVDISVDGGSDGQATANVSGGTSPYSYSWSNSGTTATITGLSYGVYTVTVTDSKGCSITGSVVVNEPRCLGFNVIATSTNVLCNGSSNGTGTAIATGGTTPYSYSWNSSPIQTSAVATGLNAGVYTVTVNDKNSCVQTANIIITEPKLLTNVMNQTNPTSIGGTNGTATANPFGGTAPYFYSWSNGGSNATINNLSAGIYSVLITDSKGCSKVDSVKLIDPPCNQIALSVVTNNVACYNGSTGSAVVILTNATAPYSIAWSNGQSGPNVSNLEAGNYSVTITDAKSCSLFRTFTITEPSQLSAGVSVNPISCNGLTDGTADVSVSGGVFPYIYLWSNNATSEDLINVGEGNYTANISDKNGCSTSVNVSFSEPTALTTSYSVTKPTCIYGSDGAIDLTVGGGTLPYSFNWSNSSTTEDLTGIQAGGYKVILNDANGCTTSEPVIIAVLQPDSVIVSDYTIACTEPGSGVSLVTINPSGGNVGTYQVSFDNGVTFQSAGDYDAILPNDSTYNVIVKDNKSCSSLITYPITINPDVVISSINFAKCFAFGTTTTAVNITVLGGDGGPYSISYDGGLNYQSAGTLNFNLAIGNTYNFVAKDKKGCFSAPFNIIIPQVLNAEINVLSNYNGYGISCHNYLDGTIDINVSGGTGMYNYIWSNSATSQDITAVSAGTYSVVVSDENGCTDSLTTILNEPNALKINVDSISNYNGYNVSCFNSSNGYIALTSTGGVGAYNFLWNNNATTEDLTNIPFGGYLITVSDANNCVLLFDTTLSQPNELIATAVSTSIYGDYNVSCYKSTNGTIDLSVAGGLTPYNFSWSNSSTTEDLSGIGAGIYTVNVTDLNGCSDTSFAIITQPDTLIASINSLSNFNGFSISCFGASNGSIDAGVSGGMAPYDYNWSNGATTQDLLLLGAGNYILTVTDSNNCVATISATLNEPNPLVAVIDSISNYNGYGVSCNSSSNGSIYTSVIGGTSNYTYLWSNGATTDDINGLIANSYVLNIEDENGCLTNVDTTLLAPAAFNPSYTYVNPGCNGMSNGSIDFNLTGGVTPYTYDWSNGATTEDLSAIPIGTYNLIYTDLNGCNDSISVKLVEPLVLSNNIAHQNVLCYGGNNAMIDINIIGGTTPYSFAWSNGETTEDVDSLTQGIYYVTITDNQGCSRTDTVEITQPDSLYLILTSPVLSNGHNVSFYEGTDGSIDLTVNGGVQPYTYVWSTNQTTEDLYNLHAGQYSVIVTDNHGCSVARLINLTEPFDLAMPTGITPNDDGKNDFFVVKGVEAYPNNVLTIYNRWGNVVYKKANYLNEWKGTNTSGDDLPEGTYFAVLEINGKEIVLNGYVEIRRK